MRRRHNIPLRNRHNILIRRRGDVPLRRLGNVPLRQCWVFHLRRTYDVTGMYREKSLRLLHDVLLLAGEIVSFSLFSHVWSVFIFDL